MRRPLPWLLVGLVTVSGAIGAALGITGHAGSPGPAAAQWVADVVSATKAAGTARVQYTEVTTSANPDLRGSTAGSGVIDFSAQTVHVTEVEDQPEWSVGAGGVIHPMHTKLREGTIGIGTTLYQSFAPVGVGYAAETGWSKQSVPRDEGDLGLASASGGAALLALTGPLTVLTVRDLGRASVDGEATTRYLVRSEARLSCPRRAGEPAPPIQSTTLWIGGGMRLVQARQAEFDSGKIPAALLRLSPEFAVRPKGSTTMTFTVRFSAFGAPVHIVPPAAVEQNAGSSFGIATGRCAS